MSGFTLDSQEGYTLQLVRADICPSRWMRLLLKSLGPGVITGAADDDPSGIATYSVAGAQHGTKLLWTALPTWPLLRRNARMAPGPGQEIETGTRALRSHSAFDRGGRRTGLRRHYPWKGPLLDGSHKWIIAPIPLGCHPDRRFEKKTDAGPTEFPLGR